MQSFKIPFLRSPIFVLNSTISIVKNYENIPYFNKKYLYDKKTDFFQNWKLPRYYIQK